MSEFRDAYGKHTTPEAEYQNGYQDGYAAGKEDCADEIARLREALECLIDEQNGPPIERHAHSWQMAMDRARAALAEQGKDQ